MKKYLIIIVLFIICSTEIYSQTSTPNGYTTNYNLKKWSQGATPSADSLNDNTVVIDSLIKERDKRIDSLNTRTINGHALSSNITILKSDLGIDTTNYVTTDASLLTSGTLALARIPSTVVINTDSTIKFATPYQLAQAITGGVDTSNIPFQNTRNVYSKVNSYTDSIIGTNALFTGNISGTFIDRVTGSTVGLTNDANTWNGDNVFNDNGGNSFAGDGNGLYNLSVSSLVGRVDTANISTDVVTKSKQDTITGTKIMSKIQTKALWSTVTTIATDIDWAVSNTFTKTLSGNTTFTFSNTQAGQIVTVAITGDVSSTVTWPTVTWQNSPTQPTQTLSKTDIYSFIKIGSIIYGTVSQNY